MQGSGFRVSGFRIEGLRFGVQGFGLSVLDFGFGFLGVGFQITISLQGLSVRLVIEMRHFTCLPKTGALSQSILAHQFG